MSHDNHGDKRGAHTIHPKGGGGGGKWLLGALAAVVLAGGGYYVWKNMGPTQSAQTAYNETLPADSYDSKPAADDELNATAETAATDGSATSSTASTSTAATPARRSTTSSTRRTVAAQDAAYVPEQNVGVSSDNIVNSEDEIVVQGDRRPQWTRTPSAYRLSAAYPERALERNREGEASVHCIVQENGSLACERMSEYPANSGFGTAALRVARMYRHAPARWDGSSAAGTPVNIHVMFRMAEDDRNNRHG